MKPHTDIHWIEEIYSTPNPRVLPSDVCPDLDRLRAAAAAELPAEERRKIMDHAVGCAYCTESWRLAIQLGARPKLPLWTHFFSILWRDLRFLFELPMRFYLYLEERLTHMGRWRLLPGAALAVVAAFIFFAPIFHPSQHGTRIERGGGAKVKIKSLMTAESLSRDQAVLRWSGPAEVSYDLRVKGVDGRVLDSAQDLAATRYQIPAEKLRDLAPGTELLWSVSVHSTDRGPDDVFNFRIRLE